MLRSTMTANLFCLFCVVDGEFTPFSVEIDRTKTVDHLKQVIKEALDPQFNDIPTKDLTLWRISIPDDQLSAAITIAALDDKTALSNPTTRLSKLFPKVPTTIRTSSPSNHREVMQMRLLSLTSCT